jgi:hypothetical protein
VTAPEGRVRTLEAGVDVPAAGVQDECSTPPLRSLIGDLLQRSRTADLALGRVRLAALDLTEAEVRGPARCRVLLGQLDASMLLDATPAHDAYPGHATRRAALLRLANWLASDRLEVRAAGIGLWTPDFSVFRDPAGATTCLLGAHYFGSPQLAVGPSFTAVLRGSADSALLRQRFEEIWRRGHDVSPAILDVVKRTAEEVGDHDRVSSHRSP